MYGNILYFDNINSIGGVEQYFYYLAKKYNDRDITIFYSNGDEKQIQRLRKLVRVKKFDGKRIKCKKAFFNYSKQIIDKVDAEEYIEIIHYVPDEADKPILHPKINRYLGVSKLVCKEFERLTGVKCELAYNPVEIDEPKKVLRLISATRLTWEKGKKRMIQLAEALDKEKIPYLWLIFTNDTKEIDNPNIIYMKPKLDIISYIKDSDYLVQLSDKESYCLSIAESLSVGTPIISTDLEVLKELDIKNKTHGYILDMDMKNIPIHDIYTKIPKFKYEPPKDNWSKYLDNTRSTYKEEQKEKIKVVFKRTIFYIPNKTEYKKGKEYILEKSIVDELLDYDDIELR